MQDPENSKTRKPWYQRAMEMANVWKPSAPKPAQVPARISDATTLTAISKRSTTDKIRSQTTTFLWKSIPKTHTHEINPNTNREKLRRCTSMRVASSFTRVCLCGPISSYEEVFRAEVAPRRSYTYPRSKQFPAVQERIHSARLSAEGRKIFRGKSLMDDVLMKRFVEEEAMMQLRRRDQMEVIRKRNMMKRKNKLGPSPLSRMVLAEEVEY